MVLAETSNGVKDTNAHEMLRGSLCLPTNPNDIATFYIGPNSHIKSPWLLEEMRQVYRLWPGVFIPGVWDGILNEEYNEQPTAIIAAFDWQGLLLGCMTHNTRTGEIGAWATRRVRPKLQVAKCMLKVIGASIHPDEQVFYSVNTADASIETENGVVSLGSNTVQARQVYANLGLFPKELIHSPMYNERLVLEWRSGDTDDDIVLERRDDAYGPEQHDYRVGFRLGAVKEGVQRLLRDGDATLVLLAKGDGPIN